jgi:hypothetical protein
MQSSSCFQRRVEERIRITVRSAMVAMEQLAKSPAGLWTVVPPPQQIHPESDRLPAWGQEKRVKGGGRDVRGAGGNEFLEGLVEKVFGVQAKTRSRDGGGRIVPPP